MLAGSFAAFVPAAQAAAPPFEPDPNSRGCVTFYDATGKTVTSGSTSDSPIAAYAQASSPGRTVDNTATLFGYAAQPGLNTLAWTHGEQMSAGNTYPVAGAPANIAGSPNPTVAGAPGELSVAQLQTDFPSTDPSTPGVYQIRIVTSGAGTADPLYFRADIQITGSTWTQIWCQSTTTSLSVSPPSPAAAGTTENLTAQVTPSTATGTVQFMDGPTNIGAPVPVSSGTASTTTTLPTGPLNLTAVFTPGDQNSFNPSTSNSVSYTVGTSTPSADLSITKTAPATASTNSPLAYTIVATNNGPGAATGVGVTDTLPSAVTFVSASSGCTNASGTVTCTIGNLANGASSTITINVTTPATPATIMNTAVVGGNETDPNTANNTATASTTVTATTTPSADLSITKTAPATASTSSPLAYSIVATNNGP
ncbi:MAG: conserved repeat domain protein, partial [Actinobacteria bacterium]|nr:conserved repeat domain protein [Actinomycetota bacterium]